MDQREEMRRWLAVLLQNSTKADAKVVHQDIVVDTSIASIIIANSAASAKAAT